MKNENIIENIEQQQENMHYFFIMLFNSYVQKSIPYVLLSGYFIMSLGIWSLAGLSRDNKNTQLNLSTPVAAAMTGIGGLFFVTGMTAFIASIKYSAHDPNPPTAALSV